MKPFAGIRVLDMTRVVSGPFCTLNLASLGAEVTKIEDREGDSTRNGSIGDPALMAEHMAGVFVMFNSGKQSLTLDLKQPEGRDIVLRLAKEADVFVENFRAGVVDRLGLGHEALRPQSAAHLLLISGYGQTGPDAQAPAFDGNIQAMSGMMAMTGEHNGPPMRAGYTVADTGTGLFASYAISGALFEREKTGSGCFIDVAMLDAAISLTGQISSGWLNGGVVLPRRGNLSISFEPTADVFETAKGSVLLAIMREAHIRLFMRELGLEAQLDDPRYATRPARVKNAASMRAMLQAEFMKGDAQHWKQRLDKIGVPCALVHEIPEALSQPQVVHRQLVEERVDQATGGIMRTLHLPFHVDGEPIPSPAPPQRLGAQNRSILAGLGFSEAEIDKLVEKRVI